MREQNSLADKVLPGHGFWPIILERKMRLYRDAIGIDVGQAAVPDPDFLFKVLTRYPSHQAMLREEFHSGYKSLENHLRGTRPVSRSKITQLAAQSGVDFAFLHAASHGNKTGPLWPDVQQFLWLIEWLGTAVFTGATNVPILCPHCNANMIEDTDPWWQRLETDNGVRLGRPEYRFAEHLLRALAGYVTLEFILKNLSVEKRCGNKLGFHLLALANEKKHPIGTWLVKVMQARKCTTLNSLLIATPSADKDAADGLSLQRLKIWSSGNELMPFAIGTQLIAGLPDRADLELRFRQARSLAFIQDFIGATCVGTSKRSKHLERHIVVNRLRCLFSNIELSFAVANGAVAHSAMPTNETVKV